MLPGFVDSHTHLVFAGDRSAEFASRMAGRPYEAGGINVTVGATRAASDDTLRSLAAARRDEGRRAGITTTEIKSGYGLTPTDEARCLRIAGEITDDTTFLGAHVVPPEFTDRADDYVEHVCAEMLPACAPHARWIDAFCEIGAFDADQCRAVLDAGRAAGLGLRLHANQLGPGPGVALAVEMGCASADHCTYLTDADVEALAGGSTVATFLPATDFSTRQPYPDARRVIDAGTTVAIATNCNPGSSYTTSMSFCIALAVRDMHMTSEEAITAATLGGAAALRRDDVGRIAPRLPRRPRHPRRAELHPPRLPTGRTADRDHDRSRRGRLAIAVDHHPFRSVCFRLQPRADLKQTVPGVWCRSTRRRRRVLRRGPGAPAGSRRCR